MRLHILGICGTFMGGLARIAAELGHEVTGCDAQVYPPMSDQLRALGIRLHEGYDAEQLGQFPADLYVVGNAMTRGKPVVEAILDRGLPYASGPQWLSENVLQGRWVLAVAGTHGKTTTSSMLAWILEAAGKTPGFLIGGVPGNFGITARKGASDFFVIEADEYDTAFFDKRSKFVWYRPRTAVLGNLEYDHADIFPDVAAIETQFHHLMRIIPSQGRVIANGNDASIARVLARGAWAPVERFGPGQAWRTGDMESETTFSILHEGRPEGVVQDWPLMGEHNRLNALAAVAAARHAGVPVHQAAQSLAMFKGVKRRMEQRGQVGGVAVYDDFAHHPTAFETTIAGLKRRAGSGRVIAVFEPRSNTMKLGTMQDRLAASLAAADLVFCYGANLGWDPTLALSTLGAKASVHQELDALVEAVARAARPGDHVLVMSNGGFGGIHAKLLGRLESVERGEAA